MSSLRNGPSSIDYGKTHPFLKVDMRHGTYEINKNIKNKGTEKLHELFLIIDMRHRDITIRATCDMGALVTSYNAIIILNLYNYL